MGGISGSGLISGIDTQGLINSLISVAARPRTLAQGRLFQLQTQQAAYFDLNSKLSTLRTAASSFRTNNVFDAKTATSSLPDILTATASVGAQPGSYSFIVDRLVSSQQQLSRGFQDFDSSAVGASSFTFESTLGRLDRDVSLNALNSGDGVVRGNIRINDGSTSEVIDLSRAGTVNEVLEAINSSGLSVTARVRDGRFEIEGATSVTNTGSANVAGSLGLSTSAGATLNGGVLSGATVYELTGDVALTSLNDGNGVSYNSRSAVLTGIPTDFSITIDTVGGPVVVPVGLGELREVTDDGGTPGVTDDDTIEVTEPAVTTVQGVLDRINTAFDDAGLDASASIDAATGAISFASNDGDITAITQSGSATTVRDLGLSDAVGTPSASVTGSRVFSGLGSVLLNNINGGGGDGGVTGDGRIGFTTANGSTVNVELDLASISTFEELIDAINEDPANNGEIVASLNDTGTGLKITDTTTGSGNLIVVDAPSSDTAAKLGILTDPAGVDSETIDGGSLQRRYVSEGTRLDTLRGGDGIGTGKIRLVDATGLTTEITIGEDMETIGELLTQARSSISSSGLALSIGINDRGDGLVISDTSGNGQAIRVEDVSGSVAANLRLAGESGVGAGNTFIDGSYETTVEFDPTDTLEDIIDAINNADTGVAVSVLNDGSGTRPFRLSMTARDSGSAGRYILDTNGFDLGLTTLDEGEDARVIFGSNDAASGILLTSSTNTLDNVITGVTIDLKNTSDEPVTVSITDDTTGTEEAINSFITAYNDILGSIENSTRYDEDTGQRGALLGDGLLLGLRQGLFGAVQNQNSGFNNAFDRLSEVGVSIGSEGRLEFDREEFREALATDPEAVEALFTRRVIADDDSSSEDLPDGVTVNGDPTARDLFDELGVIGQIEEFAKNYTDSIDGIITSRTQSLDTQILSQQKRIESLTEGLDRERARLERQFVGMEQALAQLQSQSSALSSLFASG